MKRQEFIRELEQAGCVLHRHGAKHVDRLITLGKNSLKNNKFN